MKKVISLFIIILILVLWINNLSYQSYVIKKSLGGFWEADASFCEESDLDMFCIYFDKTTDFSNNRACYVLAKRGDDIVLNEPTTANITLNWAALNNWSSDLEAPKFLTITFKEISDECADEFPPKQYMRYYPICNKIVMYYGDTITAVLYKNAVNTELNELQ